MTMRNVDLWAGLLITVAGSIATFYVIPAYVTGGFGFGLSPRFFPYICSGAITVLGAILVLSRFSGRSVARVTSPFSLKASVRLLLFTLLLASGLVIITVWGYLPGAMFLVAALMVAMGERRPLWIVPTAIGWPLVLWLLFEKLLETPLPG